MAGPTKKNRKESESEGESISDNSDSESYDGQQEIQADFEGRNPEGQDFDGIKQLLKQVFLKAHIDLSQMSDLLIAQHGIGSVLKQSFGDDDEEEDIEMTDENDVFGITSVINLSSHRETPCVKQFFSLLEELGTQHATPPVQKQLKQILTQSSKLGFLINERFVNIPAKVSVVMLNSLCDEIERMKKKDNSYDFDYYIMICKTYKYKDQGDVLFSNDEEEVFEKASELNFQFSVEKESDTALGGKWSSDDAQIEPLRKILVFKASKLKPIINEITAFVQ